MRYDETPFDERGDGQDDEPEFDGNDAFDGPFDDELDDGFEDGDESGGESAEDGEEADAEHGVPVALATTEEPIELRVALVDDERTPEGMVCMGTFRGERLIARCVVPPEAFDEIAEHHVFDVPVPVVLVAQEAPPGLQCRLFAMIPLPEGLAEEEDEDEGEPWAASVPSSRYEDAVAELEAEEQEAEGGDDSPQLVPLPLGNIVRYERDRVFPDSLPREAMDVLQKVIEGRTSEVVDRAIADLLDL